MPDEIENEDQSQSRASREAAKYRTQLREAEARIAQLEGSIGKMQSKELAAAMKDKLIDPGDFEKFVERASIVDEHGNLDGAKVKASFEALVKEKPHLAVPTEPVRRAGKQEPAKGIPISGLRRPERKPEEGRKSLEDQFGKDGQHSWNDVLNRRSGLNEEIRAGKDDQAEQQVTNDGEWVFDMSLGSDDDGGDGID